MDINDIKRKVSDTAGYVGFGAFREGMREQGYHEDFCTSNPIYGMNMFIDWVEENANNPSEVYRELIFRDLGLIVDEADKFIGLF